MIKNYVLLISLFTTLFCTAQSADYKLVAVYSLKKPSIGDKITIDMYFKNTSNTPYSVPTQKCGARGLDDVLTHDFKFYDPAKNLLNKQFRCGVGGADKRVLCGTKVIPGDSVLIQSKTFDLTQTGTYSIEYTFDFRPNEGISPNPSPTMMKDIHISETLPLVVASLNSNFSVTPISLTKEEYEKANTFQSLSEALVDPSKVFRLSLDKITNEEAAILPKLTNLKYLVIRGDLLDSIPVGIFNLDLRHLEMSLNIKSGIRIPSSIKKMSELAYFSVSSIYLIDLSGFKDGDFPNLYYLSVNKSFSPVDLCFDPVKMPKLRWYSMTQLKEITNCPGDFSKCPELTSFSLDAETVNFPPVLSVPAITSLYLNCKKLVSPLPNLSGCLQLTDLYITRVVLEELPSHLLEIPNLKKLKLSDKSPKSDVEKQLKKKGVEILR